MHAGPGEIRSSALYARGSKQCGRGLSSLDADYVTSQQRVGGGDSHQERRAARRPSFGRPSRPLSARTRWRMDARPFEPMAVSWPAGMPLPSSEIFMTRASVVDDQRDVHRFRLRMLQDVRERLLSDAEQSDGGLGGEPWLLVRI